MFFTCAFFVYAKKGSRAKILKEKRGLKRSFRAKKRFSWIQMDFYANDVNPLVCPFFSSFFFSALLSSLWICTRTKKSNTNWPKSKNVLCSLKLLDDTYREEPLFTTKTINWFIYVFPLPKEVLSPNLSSSSHTAFRSVQRVVGHSYSHLSKQNIDQQKIDCTESYCTQQG